MGFAPDTTYPPISSYRAVPLLLPCIPGRPGPRTSDGQIISVRHPQIANFTGPARPAGSLPMPILKRVQAGIQQARMHQGVQRRIRLPITVDVLTKVQRHLVGSNHPHRRALWQQPSSDSSASGNCSQTRQHSTLQVSSHGGCGNRQSSAHENGADPPEKVKV